MRKHALIRSLLLPITFVAVGCSNIPQETVDTCKEDQIMNYVPLHQTAYIPNQKEFVSESNSMLVQKGFPFRYTSGQDGTIDFSYIGNNEKRELLQLTSSTQSYISELYKIDCNRSASFVALITEDITGGYRCIVVPSQNSTMYSSDIFFLDDIFKINDIFLSDDYSFIQFNYYKDELSNVSDSSCIALQERKDVIIFE